MENKKVISLPVVATPKRPLTNVERSILGVGAVLLGSSAHAEVDVSAGVTVIAGAAAVIALVGAAKIIPNATMQVWGYVKQAFNRT